jgi:hypothetical protein
VNEGRDHLARQLTRLVIAGLVALLAAIEQEVVSEGVAEAMELPLASALPDAELRTLAGVDHFRARRAGMWRSSQTR